MLKTSMWDYEKWSVVTYPFISLVDSLYIKQAVCKELKKIMWEVLPVIALSFYMDQRTGVGAFLTLSRTPIVPNEQTITAVYYPYMNVLREILPTPRGSILISK